MAEETEHAKFAQAAYKLNTTKNKDARMADADDIIPDGYSTHANSDSNVGLYINHDKKTAVIAHRGTALDQHSRKTDVAADLSYALGLEKHSKAFKKRVKKSEKLLNDVPEGYAVDLTGHSYGGATALHTLQKSSKVRNRVNKAHLYNPLMSAFDSKTHTSGNENEKDAEANIKNKTTIHRVKGDIVSMNKSKLTKIKHHKPKGKARKSVPGVFRNAFNTVNQLATHSIANFT